MSATINYTRNLNIIPVGKTNIDVRKNYRISVLDQKDTITWGTRSNQDRTLKIWQDLRIGDVAIFLYDKKMTVAGLVTKTYQDTDAYKSIGWSNAVDYDLIIEMKRIDLVDPNILTLLNYTSTPCGMLIACKKKAKAFWDQYGHLLPLDPNSLRAAAPIININPKSPSDTFSDNARKLTEVNWIRHKLDIDPTGLGRNNDWHLDHGFSIAAAYAIGMPAWMVADPVNLHMVPGPENLSKNSKCGSIDPLMKKYPEWPHLRELYEQKIADGSATWTR